jgi:hypothetical protein
MSPAPGAGGRRVTISSMSCRGVKAFVPFQKPPLYAAVSLGGRREKTPPDAGGGENPDWEGAVAAFNLDAGDAGREQEQVVRFEVKAQVPLLGTKVVGTASVPVAYLAAADAASAPQHVSYQVKAPDGKPNGTLSFAYAIVGRSGPPSSCSAPSATATANFTPHGGGYPPPPSAPPVTGASSLYPPMQDLLPSSTYPHPSSTLPHQTMANPHFPDPNSSYYPPPAPNSVSVYRPPPDSCAACSAPPSHYSSSYHPQPLLPSSYLPLPAPPSGYPPPPPSSYPPAPPSSYPPPPPSGYPPPASNLAPPPSTYPPPPPDSGSAYPVLPRSLDRELPYYAAPSPTYPPPPGGSLYPPPGSHHPELDGAGRISYGYPPPPGSRYPY